MTGKIIGAAFLIASLGASAAHAQTPAVPATGVVMQRNLTLSLARQIADATFAECLKIGAHTSVAVVDRAGQTLLIMRSERATAQTAELARRKAFTARVFRRPSLEWSERLRTTNLSAEGQRDLADVIALGGGVPINVGDDTIGAVGSAGGPGQDKDEACARAGIAAVQDQLK
jgi:uncharacterized protein GlcG (DUF336 family)